MQQPEQIGKYRVIGVAGEGNTATVFVGHDPFNDGKVAIKVCQVTGNRDFKIARKLFFNEAHTAGGLDHANILSILDAGEQDGMPYIVMEFVEGADTLRSYVSPDNLLPLPRVVEILYQCAKALDYAHRRGVVHRDIKPSNIMLTPDGVVKIGDFGIAQHALSDQTQVMGLLGSPRYMSPEQIRDEDDVTHQTDIFSLGIVGYELATGRPPFLGRNMTQLARRILEEEPVPIETVREDVPEELRRIIARALDKRLDERYAHAHDMAVDLASLFGNLDRCAHEPSPGEHFSLARGLAFFNDFSDDELREVLAAAAWQERDAGAVMIRENDPGDAFYVLAGGEATVNVSGREVGHLRKGECFGEMAVVTSASRAASVVATEQCILLCIDRRLIERASTRCQLRFNQSFLRTLTTRLARTNDRLARCLDG